MSPKAMRAALEAGDLSVIEQVDVTATRFGDTGRQPAHQMGGALAGIGAGAVRTFSGDYLLAFMTSGLACLLASLLVLRIRGLAPAIVPAV